jgi:hypothetical protein
MNPELAKAVDHAERLLSATINVVGAAKIDLNQDRARNPIVVGLTILCCSITNFRASLLLAQQEQVLEARALVRLMYENLLWLAAHEGVEFGFGEMVGCSHMSGPLVRCL